MIRINIKIFWSREKTPNAERTRKQKKTDLTHMGFQDERVTMKFKTEGCAFLLSKVKKKNSKCIQFSRIRKKLVTIMKNDISKYAML
jgi:hypothetical protein